jgi:hypothetical protein
VRVALRDIRCPRCNVHGKARVAMRPSLLALARLAMS